MTRKSLAVRNMSKTYPEFYTKVWNACKDVPRGKVTTYKEIAEHLGTKAYRAVGTALNKNPYAPKVPCHRVVNSDESLGGFADGRNKKKLLLQNEGIMIRSKTDTKKKEKIKNFDEVLYRFDIISKK